RSPGGTWSSSASRRRTWDAGSGSGRVRSPSPRAATRWSSCARATRTPSSPISPTRRPSCAPSSADPMIEVELKCVVDDVARRRAAIEAAGAALTFEGTLLDRRYDTGDHALAGRDHVLRVREYGGAGGRRAELDWK